MNQLLIDRVDKVGATLQQYSFSFRQKKVLEKDIAHNLHKIQVYPPPTLYKIPWCCLYRGPTTKTKAAPIFHSTLNFQLANYTRKNKIMNKRSEKIKSSKWILQRYLTIIVGKFTKYMNNNFDKVDIPD